MTVEDPIVESRPLLGLLATRDRPLSAYLLSWRLVLILSLLFANILSVTDRTVLSIFYKLTYDGGYRTLSFRSALFFCYGACITPVVGGRSAELFGGKWTLLWAMIAFGCANCALIFLVVKVTETSEDSSSAWDDDQDSVWTVMSVTTLGMTNGLLLPSFMPLISTWFPARERIFSLSFTLSGLELGSMLLIGLSAWMNIQAHFILITAFAFIWCVSHWRNTSSTPEWHPHISLPEVQHITTDRPQPIALSSEPESRGAVKWRLLFTDQSLIALYLVHTIVTSVWRLLVGLLPSYLSSKFGLENSSLRIYALIPLACSLVCSIGCGFMCDRYIISKAPSARVKARRRVCRAAVLVGTCVPAIAIPLLPFVASLWHALFIITFAVVCTSIGAKCGYLANILDLAPNHSGIVAGMCEMISMVPPIVLYHLIMEGVVGQTSFESDVTRDVVIPMGCLVLCITGFVYQGICRVDPVLE